MHSKLRAETVTSGQFLWSYSQICASIYSSEVIHIKWTIFIQKKYQILKGVCHIFSKHLSKFIKTYFTGHHIFIGNVTECCLSCLLLYYSKTSFWIVYSYNNNNIMAELWQPKGLPSGASYPYRKEKDIHELIFSWLSWLVVWLVGTYRWQWRSRARWLPYSS